jgi:hypothetical protein
VVSARIQHAPSEMNSGFGPAPSAIGARGADALQSADEGGQEVGGRPPRCTVRGTDTPGTTRYSSTLNCTYTFFRMPSRAGGGASTGRTRAGRPGMRTPRLAAVAPTRRRYGPRTAPIPPRSGSPGCRLRVRPHIARLTTCPRTGSGPAGPDPAPDSRPRSAVARTTRRCQKS